MAGPSSLSSKPLPYHFSKVVLKIAFHLSSIYVVTFVLIPLLCSNQSSSSQMQFWWWLHPGIMFNILPCFIPDNQTKVELPDLTHYDLSPSPALPAIPPSQALPQSCQNCCCFLNSPFLHMRSCFQISQKNCVDWSVTQDDSHGHYQSGTSWGCQPRRRKDKLEQVV